MRWPPTPLLLAAFLALAPPAALADVRFDHLSVEHGLSTTTVATLLQDRMGFLWVGTEGGLDRYDGYGFRTYRRDPDDPASLSSSFVQALYEAPEGGLWVGTFGGGLNHLDPTSGRATRYRHDPDDPATLSSDQVLAIHPGDAGTLWVGTAAGLDRLDRRTGAVQRYSFGSDGALVIRKIAADQAGILWLGTSGGVMRFDPKTGQVRTVLPEASAVWALHLDDDGTLWAGFDGNGLARLGAGGEAPVRFAATGQPGALCGARVHAITRDATGALWAATNGGGLCSLDEATGSFELYAADPDDPYALPSNGTRTLLVDRGGLLWVGTWGDGLAKMRRTAFSHVRATPEQGFRSTDMMRFAEDADGSLWVGTYDAGLYRYDPATDRAVQDPGWPQPLRTESVRGLVFDRNGALWATAGGEQGLYRQDPRTGRFHLVPLPDGVEAERALNLHVGPDGTVWAAFYGPGLCRAAPEADVLSCPAAGWTGDRALRSTLAYNVFADSTGLVWVSQWGAGVDVVDPARGRVASYVSAPDDTTSLSENNVTSFLRDREGRLWLATYGGGLNQFDPALGDGGGFRHVTQSDGLPDGTVYGVLQDDAGRLWLSTNRGLAVYDPAAREVSTFGVEDGLQAQEFNGNSFLRLRDGRMAFGGIGGFNLFDPARVWQKTPPPPVALTGLRILGVQTEVSPDGGGGLTLRHDENAVTFEFAALDFTAPARNRYAYRLDGYEEAWVETDGVRQAAFTNLAPGRYTFRVRAANSSGIWADDALVVPVHIRPAWWQTLAFRLGALTVVLGGLVLGIREVSQRRLRAEVRRLETERRVQDERARISRDLHDHVGAQLSSLLAGVELAKLARRPGGDGASGDPLESVEADARETIRQLRETIWALHDESVTLGGFRDRLDADLRQRLRHASRPSASLTLDGDPARTLGPAQALHLYRIAREATTNTLKYADADHLRVRIGVAGDVLTLEVSDDGTFRPEGDGGYGLASMRSRAAEMGGTFEIDTTRGTTVRVTVPLQDSDGLPRTGEAAGRAAGGP